MQSDNYFSRALAEDLAFGSHFAPTAQDPVKALALESGRLDLPPNPSWRIPQKIAWNENPFKEPNWVAQFHMMRWIDPLRRQAEKGDDRFIDIWLRIAKSWIENNPPGRGRVNYAWADMVEAGRALTFAFALPTLEDLRSDEVPVIIESLAQHGDWLAEESHIRIGNHALQQHQALLVIGAVLEREEWVTLAEQRSVEMLNTAYDDQGINEEGAVQYHQINFQWWNALGARVRIATGTVPEAFERVAKAPVAMAHATRPDGSYELIGDTEVFSPRNLGHPAITYVSSAGTEGIPPQDRVAVYESGYAYGRSTWGDAWTRFSDASFYSLRFGPQNRIHGHADGMALTLWSGGESLLVDSGKLAYDAADPHRVHLLSREAHNSVSVRGVEYDRTASVDLLLSQRSEDVEHYRFEDTGYPGVRLTRDVLIALRWNLAVVVDTFAAEEDVTVSQWWHLSPDASHRKEDSAVVTRTATNELRFTWPEGAANPKISRGTTRPIQGWYSPTWRKLIPTRTVETQLKGTSGSLATVLSFSASRTPAAVAVSSSDCAEGLLLHIDRGGAQPFSALLTDAAATLVRGTHTPADLAKVLR